MRKVKKIYELDAESNHSGINLSGWRVAVPRKPHIARLRTYTHAMFREHSHIGLYVYNTCALSALRKHETVHRSRRYLKDSLPRAASWPHYGSRCHSIVRTSVGSIYSTGNSITD